MVYVGRGKKNYTPVCEFDWFEIIGANLACEDPEMVKGPTSFVGKLPRVGEIEKPVVHKRSPLPNQSSYYWNYQQVTLRVCVPIAA